MDFRLSALRVCWDQCAKEENLRSQHMSENVLLLFGLLTFGMDSAVCIYRMCLLLRSRRARGWSMSLRTGLNVSMIFRGIQNWC